MARCVWPLLIGVCGSIDGLVVCVYVCGSVCVVMGLDRLIGASWVSLCVALCVEPVPKVKGEREEKK